MPTRSQQGALVRAYWVWQGWHRAAFASMTPDRLEPTWESTKIHSIRQEVSGWSRSPEKESPHTFRLRFSPVAADSVWVRVFDQGEGSDILDAIVAEGRCGTCGTPWDRVVNVEGKRPEKIEGGCPNDVCVLGDW